MRYLGPAFLLLTIYACRGDLPPGAQAISLDREIYSVGATTYQVYWGVGDTAAWEKIVAEADTIHEEENYLKLRSSGIWYEASKDSTGRLKAEQHYPGWERALDSVEVTNNIVYSRRWERQLAEVPAADILLGPDSVRIAIVHPTGRAFPWQRFELDRGDYLALYPPGIDSTPVLIDQENIGRISNRTVFRVGRNHYALKSLSDDRREMVIEPVRKVGELPVTAELDLNYRQVAVLSADSVSTYVKQEKAKELILFFTSVYGESPRVLARLDSFHQAMPRVRREGVQIAAILQHQMPETAREMLDTLPLKMPVYVGSDKTCLRMNCSPYYPYYVHVNAAGRITTFWGKADDLVDRFGGEPVNK